MKILSVDSATESATCAVLDEIGRAHVELKSQELVSRMTSSA